MCSKLYRCQKRTITRFRCARRSKWARKNAPSDTTNGFVFGRDWLRLPVARKPAMPALSLDRTVGSDREELGYAVWDSILLPCRKIAQLNFTLIGVTRQKTKAFSTNYIRSTRL